MFFTENVKYACAKPRVCFVVFSLPMGFPKPALDCIWILPVMWSTHHCQRWSIRREVPSSITRWIHTGRHMRVPHRQPLLPVTELNGGRLFFCSFLFSSSLACMLVFFIYLTVAVTFFRYSTSFSSITFLDVGFHSACATLHFPPVRMYFDSG